MNSFSELIAQGPAHAWLFIPTAIVLGALHGLEPGHSKTMMAAFIIAVRGTVKQAVLLGLCAAISHSLLIWVLAAAAIHFGSQWNAETTEPYFQMVSGLIIIAMALWMFLRTRGESRAAAAHSHGHEGGGPHGGQMLDTGHGFVEISVFETNVPPRFRLYFFDAAKKPGASSRDTVTITTVRPGGENQTFDFAPAADYLEARSELPEPHEFKGTLTLSHSNHGHEYPFAFTEHDHGHDHEGLHVSDDGYQDAHERAHAADIVKRFSNQQVTTSQIVLFGLTGGLLPCPAALTILLVCLQLKKLILGFTLVLCFSIGLALTMVASGVLAAWGVHHASKRFRGFGEFARKAPYFSSALLLLMGGFIAFEGWRSLH